MLLILEGVRLIELGVVFGRSIPEKLSGFLRSQNVENTKYKFYKPMKVYLRLFFHQ